MRTDREYCLGLDLGAESVGWQLITLVSDQPTCIAACGVHTFDAGVEGGQEKIEAGRDSSRAVARRTARQMRRQIRRRRARRGKLLRILQRSLLLPEGDVSSPERVHQYFLALDASLLQADKEAAAPALLAYRLRAAALDRALASHELGRALYHLGQRRGFKSNRRSAPRPDEKPGELKAAIGDLQKRIQDAGVQTLGEYLARLDPEQEKVRRVHTHRDMFTHEFDAIWNAQRPHHPSILTDELRKQLHSAMFDQRPLRSQSHLIGHCELEPGRRRAPLASRVAQEFRLLQKLNDLLIEPRDAPPRPLTAAERDNALDALRTSGEVKFSALRKRLKLPKDVLFNLERGKEEKLAGNRTESKLTAVFGERWGALTEPERDLVVEDLLSIEDERALERRAKDRWGLDDQAAAKLATLRLEDGHSRHSRMALTRLVQRMADGTPYMTARRALYPESFKSVEPLSKLPPVRDALKDLRNPAVERALTELRKVVNAIVARFGVPDTIRIELARDLRNPRKFREEIATRSREREQEREKACKRILHEMKIQAPRRDDIEKVLLADECRWHCPYTGRPINWDALLGSNPQFDVEHIIPFSRSLDDSFANKTLCYHEENRQRKRNRTPHQAYSADSERWNEILSRVRMFAGPFARAKLRRFMMTDAELDEHYGGFVARQLNDTRYASRLAAEYLGALYGGLSDADGRQRVFVSSGGVTAFLRNEWNLNSILGLRGEKNRTDHRHHAVDALVIALSTPAVVKMLADAAERADSVGRRRFAQVSAPWHGFLDEAREKIARITVSRRVNHRVRGALHKESFYSRPIRSADGREHHHIRKSLAGLTKRMVGQIVDPVIRALVEKKLAELGGDPKRAFADPANHPFLAAKDGRQIPIYRVRIRVGEKPAPVGAGASRRYVVSESNHHAEIVAQQDKRGRGVWRDECVSMKEAYDRKRRGEPMIRRDHRPGIRLVFSLYKDDCVEMRDADGERRVYRVERISRGDIEFRLHSDGRRAKDVKQRTRATSPGFWLEREVRKVTVTHLGEVIPCND